MGENTSIYKKASPKHVFREVMNFILSFGFVILFLMCVVTLHSVPTGSMQPLIPAGSTVVCWRLPFLVSDPAPHRGDVVSFTDPDDKSKKLLKRVIALPGETISFKDGNVYINGELLNETYLPENGITFSQTESFTVPENSFFAMGDNRKDSVDSRFKATPFIPFENIYSKWLFTMPKFFDL